MKFNDKSAVRLLETLPEALMVISSDGTILFFNQTAEHITGYSEQDVMGSHVTRLLPQSERRRLDVVDWLQRWAMFPDQEQLRYLYLDGLTKSGDKKLYRVRVSMISPDKKDDSDFAIVFRDITEEHESSVNLRHQQLINNRIMAIGEDAILSVDESGTICFWNKKAEELFGYPENEVVGQPLTLLLAEADREGHQNQIQQFASGNLPSRLMGQRGEIRGRHKDGTIIPLEAAITKTNIENKMFLSAQIRDIRQRKAIEQALSESEARFRVVFEHAFEAIALLDAKGTVLEMNHAAKSLLPEGESEGLNFWDLNWWSNSDVSGSMSQTELDQAREDLKENVMKVISGESVRLMVELSQSGNEIRKIDFSLNPVQDEQGKTKHVIAEGRDITSLGNI